MGRHIGPIEITFLRWFFDLLPAPIKQEIKVRSSFHKFISILEFVFSWNFFRFFQISLYIKYNFYILVFFFSEYFLVLFCGGWTPQSEIKSSWLSGLQDKGLLFYWIINYKKPKKLLFCIQKIKCWKSDFEISQT